MSRVAVTGLGFISSIGNDADTVADSLRHLKHGFEVFPSREGEEVPIRWYGSVKGFDTTSLDPEDWTYPKEYRFSRMQLKTMSPHVLYSHCAVLDAVEDAGLTLAQISDPRTGLYSASAGSPQHQQNQMNIMDQRGIMRCSPFSVIVSTVGTINFNLGASLKIKGAVCAMASACASSAHALGFAYDEIRSGRQDRMIVVGAEDGNREALLPFASMRALSTRESAEAASCPFDARRSGFVGTGGAAVLILESEAIAKARGAKIYSEFAGWGQAADGHSPAMSHPEGDGLERSMENALQASGVSAAEVDYINAHGTSTQVGDLSEMRAMKAVFSHHGLAPKISSTKALTGHGLSLAGALEAGICNLAMREGFVPGSAHISELDPAAEGLNIIRATENQPTAVSMSNNSGFGGANVSLVFRKWND